MQTPTSHFRAGFFAVLGFFFAPSSVAQPAPSPAETSRPPIATARPATGNSEGTFGRQSDTGHEPLLPHTPHGNGHLLVALGPTMERSAALAEVVKRSGGRIVVRRRPVKPVRLYP